MKQCKWPARATFRLLRPYFNGGAVSATACQISSISAAFVTAMQAGGLPAEWLATACIPGLLLGLYPCNRMPSRPPISPEDLKARMDAVERLTNLFKAERMAYLVMTGLSVVILITCAGLLLVQRNDTGYGAITGLFGSSGTITYTTGRLLYMWNQALRLLAGERTSPR